MPIVLTMNQRQLGSAQSVAAVKAASQVSQKTFEGPSHRLVSGRLAVGAASVGKIAQTSEPADAQAQSRVPSGVQSPTDRSSALSIILANRRLKEHGIDFGDLTAEQKNSVIVNQIHILKEARTKREAGSQPSEIVASAPEELVSRHKEQSEKRPDESPETGLASFRLCKKLKESREAGATSSEPPSLPSAGAASPARPKFSAKNTGVGTADIDEILHNDTTSPRILFPAMLTGPATDELATPAIGHSTYVPEGAGPETARLAGVQTEYAAGSSPGAGPGEPLLPFEVYALTHIHQMTEAEKVAMYEDQLKQAIDI